MGWKLAPDVTFCIASNKAIFLDHRADRYAWLPDQMNGSFVQWVLGDRTGHHRDVAAMLERAGLLVPVEGDVAPTPFSIVAARHGLSPPPAPPTSLLGMLRFCRALHQTRCRLARQGLSGALAHVSHRRAALHQHRDARATAAALLSAGAALEPGEDCLVRSLALVDSLHRAGSDGTVVIGVLAMPFGAHCWVQDHDWSSTIISIASRCSPRSWRYEAEQLPCFGAARCGGRCCSPAVAVFVRHERSARLGRAAPVPPARHAATAF
jgi:hypothetical protein